MIKDNLCKLCNSDAIGHIFDTQKVIADIIGEYMPIESGFDNCVVGTLAGQTDKTVLLDAHCDQIGFIVTAVFEDGFVKVSPIGGIDARILPSKTVKIHSKSGEVKATFCSIPPHLKSNDDNTPATFDDLYLDTGVLSGICDTVSVGDYATFDSEFCELNENRVVSKSLDNRCGVAALLRVAEKIYNKKLPYTVKFLFSTAEELGLRGAKCAAFGISPDAAISVDVSFGDHPGIEEEKCKPLGSGAMIGISPVLSKEITDKLFLTAKQKGIKHSAEIMNGTTGTNADVISVTKSGVPCGLISIPIRNMHTPVEVCDIRDIEACADIIAELLLSGGVL